MVKLYNVYGYRRNQHGHPYEERLAVGLYLPDAEKFVMHVKHAWDQVAIVDANEDIGWCFCPPEQGK